MTNGVNDANAAAIRHLEEELSEQGFDASLLAASAEIPYDVVLVPIESVEEEAGGWNLELSFLPSLEEELGDTALLQCFAGLPVEVADGAELPLVRLIALINAKLPLVGFGYLEAQKLLFFRQVMMLSRLVQEVSDQLVVESIYMIGYLLNSFAQTFTGVASGKESVEEAVAKSPYGFLYG